MKLMIERRGERVKEQEGEMLGRAFRELYGKTLEIEKVIREEGGKPVYTGKEQFYFNFSHSEHFLALAVSTEGAIGVDLEEPREVPERMRRRILALGEEPIDNSPLKTFVLKEAYAKMLGAGLSLGLQSVMVAEILGKCSVQDCSTDEYFCYVVTGLKAKMCVWA